MRIKKGDNVKVIAGKEKGKTGKIVQVFSAVGTVVVEGLNVGKKHLKSRQGSAQSKPGQVVEFSAPIHRSNVMLVCQKCGKPTRIGMKMLAGEKAKKVRVCRRCNEVIE